MYPPRCAYRMPRSYVGSQPTSRADLYEFILVSDRPVDRGWCACVETLIMGGALFVGLTASGPRDAVPGQSPIPYIMHCSIRDPTRLAHRRIPGGHGHVLDLASGGPGAAHRVARSRRPAMKQAPQPVQVDHPSDRSAAACRSSCVLR